MWVVATPLLLWHLCTGTGRALKLPEIFCTCVPLRRRLSANDGPCPAPWAVLATGHPPWSSSQPSHSDVKWRSLPWFCSDMSHCWMRLPFAFPVPRLSAARLEDGYAAKYL